MHVSTVHVRTVHVRVADLSCGSSRLGVKPAELLLWLLRTGLSGPAQAPAQAHICAVSGPVGRPPDEQTALKGEHVT